MQKPRWKSIVEFAFHTIASFVLVAALLDSFDNNQWALTVLFALGTIGAMNNAMKRWGEI